MGAGGQLLGAAPIQLANVRAAAQAGSSNKLPEAETLESLNPELTAEIKRIKGTYRGTRTQKYKEMTKQRKGAYEKYMKQRQNKVLAQNNKPISPEGGMII